MQYHIMKLVVVWST